jgi:hypothetical protein
MSTVNTSKFSFVWGGIPSRGFADGDAVAVAWDNAVVVAYSGTRGEGTLVNGKDSSGKITVRLQNNSVTIKEYTQLFESIVSGQDEAPEFTYKKRDGSEQITITGTCNLEKHPDEKSSKEMPVCELVFVSANMVKERS